MRTHEVARTLGFAVPTVAMVTAGHLIVDGGLASDQFWGESIDGVVSGLWFAGLFGVGCLLRVLWARRRGTSAADSFARASLDGMIVGVLLWAGLLAFWSVVPHKGPNFPQQFVFIAQSSLMSVVGALVPRIRPFGARRVA